MKNILLVLLLTSQYYAICQSPITKSVDKIGIENNAKNEFLFILPLQKIKSDLSNSPRSNESKTGWIKMKLPFTDGVYHEVEVAEAPVVADEIYQRYPENRSYKVRGLKDKYISGRLSITNKGMSALLYTRKGNVFIEPAEGRYHKAYDFDSSTLETMSCGTDHSKYKSEFQSTSRVSIGSNERKYTMAVACTGEFSAKHGNNLSVINGVITDYLTLLNTLYERDMAVTFELTADNDDIVFFNAATDGLNPSNSSTQLSSAQTVINGAIGSSNYDIGHVFHEIDPPSNGWWGSGVASLGVVCSSSSKARGWSGCGGNYPNSFWMGIFAHEVGHQFSATHTFYGTSGNCGGSQRSVGNGVEPGSGNSLMSYEGSCGASGSCSNHNISPQSSFYYFHSHSMSQIQSFVSGSGSCFTSTSSGNTPPIITMPASMTIPTETPFYLSATATDADGDPLLMSWEQVDTDNISLSCPNGAPNDAATSTTAPLFRSFDPSASGNLRYFPQLSDILDDTQTMGEILPEIGRTIDMRFSARGIDANGISGVSYEDVTITVDGNSGPFEVTTASTPTGYLPGGSVNVMWTVGNTNQSPISCSNVNILFSTDGGNSFPLTLASNTPNDGSHTVTMPATGTEEGRIKVEAVGNVFFSINKGDISIISDCEPNSSEILNDESIVADEGDPSLNLELVIGEQASNISGNIEGADPNSNLIGRNGSTGSCVTISTLPGYDTYTLTATATDVYNFNTSSSGDDVVLNFYNNTYNPSSGCQNWITSSFNFFPPSSFNVTNPISVSLSEGDVVELVVSGIFSNDSGAYSVGISSNGGGQLISTTVIPNGFVYKYVIYNSANTIIAIEDDADLSDGSTYSGDVYTVKGLMVLSAADLSSYIGQSFASLQSAVLTGAVCGEFSSNDVTVTINGCNPGTKTVTSVSDNGSTGTLRQRIEDACPGDVIEFAAGLNNATIILNEEIIVSENISIVGLGINNLSISGDDASRIFVINPGVTMSISGMSLIDGFALNNGGAFVNNGTLDMRNIRFEGNRNGGVPKAFTNLGSIAMSDSVDILD